MENVMKHAHINHNGAPTWGTVDGNQINLPDGTTEPTRNRIDEVLNGQKPSDVW